MLVAKTLLYLRDKYTTFDPETGDQIELEHGYIQPGQAIPIEVEADRRDIWLALGHVIELPEAPAIETPKTESTEE